MREQFERKTATVTVRGKTTTIQYVCVDNGGPVYASVIWENGKETIFYKGMYGNKERWENHSMPDDLIDVLSELFNKEKPIPHVFYDPYRK